MAQYKGRKKLFTVLAVIVALLLVVAVVTVVKSLTSNKSSDSSQTASKDAPAVSDKSKTTDTPATTQPAETTTQPSIDPATVTTVDIEPASLTVSYLKGIGGFDFEVLKTMGGTKCTNDQGQFASIIVSPSADESTTLAKTITVDGTTYGLSLADATCTNDADLLKQYQDAFSGPFSLLKKM